MAIGAAIGTAGGVVIALLSSKKKPKPKPMLITNRTATLVSNQKNKKARKLI
jgi:hypothetical protein